MCFGYTMTARVPLETSTADPDSQRDYSRLVCCTDGSFRPPIAAEMFEERQRRNRPTGPIVRAR